MQNAQFIIKPLRRCLIPTRVRATTAIGFQEAVDLRNHRCRCRTRRKIQAQIIEGSIHVICHRQRAIVHPHDAETLVVRQRLTCPRFKDKFRRKPDAAHAQCFAATIDHRHQLIADAHFVFQRKSLTQNHFAAFIRSRKTSAPQKDTVKLLFTAILGQRNNLTRRRFGNSRQIQRHIHHHPRLDRRNTRQVRHPLGHR